MPNLDQISERLRPGHWLMEAGSHPPSLHCPARLLEPVGTAASGVALSLHCDTLLRLDLGPALISTLAALGCAVGGLAGLALHEVLVNAALHGNLGVQSGRSMVWDDLSARHQRIQTALADPARADSVVTTALGWDEDRLLAVVADEGPGYPSAPVEHWGDPVADHPRASGRGLQIARAAGAVELSAGGRCLRLTMSRHPPARA